MTVLQMQELWLCSHSVWDSHVCSFADDLYLTSLSSTVQCYGAVIAAVAATDNISGFYWRTSTIVSTATTVAVAVLCAMCRVQ